MLDKRANPIFYAVVVAALSGALLGACRDRSRDASATSDGARNASAKVPWTTYTDPGGAFRARFFSEPKASREEEAQPNGMKLVTTSVSADDQGRLFMVTKLELHDVPNYDCATGLSGMVKSSLEKMGCTPDQDQPSPLGDKPGRDVLFTCQKQPARGRMQAFCDAHDLGNGRVNAYSIMALYQNALWSPEDADSFMKSFAIL